MGFGCKEKPLEKFNCWIIRLNVLKIYPAGSASGGKKAFTSM